MGERNDPDLFYIYAKCSHCGEKLRVQIHSYNNLSVTYDDTRRAYALTKTIRCSKCPNRMKAAFEFTWNHNPIWRVISGGEPISRDEYEAGAERGFTMERVTQKSRGKGGFAMERLAQQFKGEGNRIRLIAAVGILIIALAAWGGVALRKGGQTVVVVHWSNSHPMRQGLLPDMAAQFNKASHRTKSGKRIEVKPFRYGSSEQVADLVSRVTRGVPLDQKLPDPTIVTPSADHWLISGNYIAGRPLVDLSKSKSIVRPFIGIVTYRDMAECLGWPKKEIGYADVIALRDDPLGWRSYPCAKAEWGQRPLVAYTDPTTSTTGRSVLFTIYSIASGKPPDRLTAADVTDPKVVGYVKRFQGLVDHYMIGTIPLNAKVYQGPRYGHFFLIPEDNLIHLYEGTEFTIGPDGMEVKAPPISRPMVMIYPKEGSVARNNCACIVQAPWVTREHTEAADKWVDFIRKDENQRAFMASGFRPGTSLPPTDPISGRYGLDPTEPAVEFKPALIRPEVAAAIDRSWEDVKKPGIVAFVLDVSGSMSGNKIEQAKDGLIRALDAMAKNNQVGLVTFDGTIRVRIAVASLSANRFAIANAVQEARVGGQTALYDAIKAGIEMTDAASGEERAIRGVVVLTDGQANEGQTQLDDLVKMMSRNEVAIKEFSGIEAGSAVEAGGKVIHRNDVVGTGLAMKTRYPIQVFFIGIGDADMEIGRILAEATGAEFQGATEKDLANVLEEFSKYF